MSNAQNRYNQFSNALKLTRRARGKSQEDFGLISSRTYVSTLERGLKSPTLSKIEDLAGVLSIHPLTLLVLSYTRSSDSQEVHELLGLVAQEIAQLHASSGSRDESIKS
jgi:transcriptional regulator with XRE-family HTH domain